MEKKNKEISERLLMVKNLPANSMIRAKMIINPVRKPNSSPEKKSKTKLARISQSKSRKRLWPASKKVIAKIGKKKDNMILPGQYE